MKPSLAELAMPSVAVPEWERLVVCGARLNGQMRRMDLWLGMQCTWDTAKGIAGQAAGTAASLAALASEFQRAAEDYSKLPW